MSEKTKEEILKEFIDKGAHSGGVVLWSYDALQAMQAYADRELKKPNEFIRDIAQLLGEDGLGFDGLSWTIDDFKNAIDQEKRSTAIAFAEWVVSSGYGDRLVKDNTWRAGHMLTRTTDDLYDLYINSLDKTVKKMSEKTCDKCIHLNIDNSPDQTGPGIWCGKKHFDGIGSKEEEEDLIRPNECPDFLVINSLPK